MITQQANTDLMLTALTLLLLATGMPAGTSWPQDTVYWKGGASTAWSSPANWTNDMDSTSVLPGPGTTVVIDNRYGAPANMPLLNLSPGGLE